jgi:hypothetical protein
VVLTLELGEPQVEVFPELAQPRWHYRQDNQWSAQQVPRVSPSVDYNWNKVFSFWTYLKAFHTPQPARLRLL